MGIFKERIKPQYLSCMMLSLGNQIIVTVIKVSDNFLSIDS